MIFGSICSGIEAASVAWEPLGWRAVWLAEIEAFPSAVLAHHYPDVPNVGDMMQIAELVRLGWAEAPDVLVGGTPCQAFSVAGLRGSLTDARGALTLEYIRILDEIDRKRENEGKPAAVAVWENVPGVLTTSDNAFGCFLAGLAGCLDPVTVPEGKWWRAGLIVGPSRTVAWRVLDAQFFGVAQRRRRVFVVASSRSDIDIGQILFEFDSVRRDIAPSREAREETPGTAGSGVKVSCSRVTATFDRQSSGEYGTAPVASTMAARDYKSPSDLIASIHGTQDPIVANDMAHCLGRNGGQENAVAYPIDALSMGRNGDFDDIRRGLGVGSETDPQFTLKAGTRHCVATTIPIMQVRRLTPTECERLQGFPDGYTLVPVKGKPAADGPRYKALGNSMAVPVMAWIGARIAEALKCQ